MNAFTLEYQGAPAVGSGAPELWSEVARATARLHARLVPRYRVEVIDCPVPYTGAVMMAEDMRAGHLWISTLGLEHPTWSAEDNLKFRAVHDILGHEAAPPFTLEGEVEAWRAQCRWYDECLWSALHVEVVHQAAAYFDFGLFQTQKIFRPRCLTPVVKCRLPLQNPQR